MEHYKITTICISSVLAIGLAMMCHELAHVFAGSLAGGSPTLITSTEVRGDFEARSPAGFVAFGIAGSVVNALFCGFRWWLLERRPLTAELQLFSWLFFLP